MFANPVSTTLGLIFQGFGMWEGIIIAILGVLIFGTRLPEVGRSIGKGIVEFKKGRHRGRYRHVHQAAAPHREAHHLQRQHRRDLRKSRVGQPQRLTGRKPLISSPL